MSRITCMLLSLGLLAVGCSQATETADTGPAETVTAQKPVPPEEPTTEESRAEEPATPVAEDSTERMKREVVEAGQAIAGWAADSRETLIETAQKGLTEVDQQIAQLETRAADLTGEAKTRFEEQNQQLQQKRQAFEERLEELRNSGDDAWKELSGGLRSAFQDLKNATDNAAKQFE